MAKPPYGGCDGYWVIEAQAITGLTKAFVSFLVVFLVNNALGGHCFFLAL